MPQRLHVWLDLVPPDWINLWISPTLANPGLIARPVPVAKPAGIPPENAAIAWEITTAAAASIPFRREGVIGHPALGIGHRGDLRHFVVGQHEVEDLDIFRQPLDLRGPR